jgi:hypothetical protein
MAVFDSTRGLFFTSDPNGAQQLVQVDPSTGASTNIGSVPTDLGDAGYSPQGDIIYSLGYQTGQFYRITTSNGGSPISVTNGGTYASGLVGLAVVPGGTAVPEPGALALLAGLGVAGLVLKRRGQRDQA